MDCFHTLSHLVPEITSPSFQSVQSVTCELGRHRRRQRCQTCIKIQFSPVLILCLLVFLSFTASSGSASFHQHHHPLLRPLFWPGSWIRAACRLLLGNSPSPYQDTGQFPASMVSSLSVAALAATVSSYLRKPSSLLLLTVLLVFAS